MPPAVMSHVVNCSTGCFYTWMSRQPAASKTMCRWPFLKATSMLAVRLLGMCIQGMLRHLCKG